MKRLLFIIVLISIAFLSYGQREKDLPLRPSSTPSDTVRVLQNGSSIMLRSVLQSDIYDSLAVHTDTLQALRADLDAGLSADLSDSIAAHRIELDNHTDSIAAHRIELNNAVDSIADHRTDIDANTSQIATNGTNISTNSVNIIDNTNDISDLQDSITKHTDTLQVHQDHIAALFDTTALHLDSLQLHETQIGALFDTAVIHLDTLQLHQTQIAELAAAGTEWTRSGTSLSPTTTDDDILLSTEDEMIFFGDSDTRLEWNGDEILFSSNTSQVLQLSDAEIVTNEDFDPNATDILNNINYLYIWSNKYSIKGITPPSLGGANTGIFYMSSVDEKPYFLNSSTTYDLAEPDVISHSLTDGAPTDAQIDSATGTTPAAVGSGWRTTILDSDGSALLYIIISDGSNWQYTAMTIAL